MPRFLDDGSRLVLDHRLPSDVPFRFTENGAPDAIAMLLLGERPAGMAEVGELLLAA